MHGLMQRAPLLLSSVLEHAAVNYRDREIVSRMASGAIHRTTYGGLAGRARQLARALDRLGVQSGECVATLAWNTHRHMELYFGVTGRGSVLHTVNPRLFPAQIEYMIDHARDGLVFFDLSFTSLLEQIAPRLPHVRAFIALAERSELPETSLPNLLCYEDLLAAEEPDYNWPALDENSASTLCYTSGTTGNPKGVLYSHRSLLLHAFVGTAADGLALSARDTVLLVVPLFHVNAWGLPFSAAMCGAKLVLPGARLDGESLFGLMQAERCTFSVGVPTVWLSFLDYVRTHRDSLDLDGLRMRRIMVGGSAAPVAMIAALEEMLGATVVQAWGMTETSPIATVGTLLPHQEDLPAAERHAIQALQGRPVFGVEVRIVDPAGAVLPRDGKAVGEIQVRGPWVIERYFRGDVSATDPEGWFATGDVASITPDGFIRITDRVKDVIKSGGEWISSIDLENAAVGHPDVAEAAVIGIPHPRWQERPLLLLRCRPGRQPEAEEVLAFLADKVPRWWLPDEIRFVDELPHTATGKLLKSRLRELYASASETTAETVP
jgi:acyl-CoA synthetase (AMP-forming)/AMP-acid ligase II